MRPSSAVLLPALALSLLAGCGGDDHPQESAATTSAAPTSGEGAPGSSSPGTSGSPAATGSPGAAGPGQVPRPPAGTCEPVAESADGRYVVADAGEVTLRLEDGEVQLDVSSSSGWGTMAASTPIEAVVTFTRGDEELALEAEREDGRLVIRICADDA